MARTADIHTRETSMFDQIHRRTWELLADGRWRDRETVIALLMPLIPPGVAMRKAEQLWRDGLRAGPDARAPERHRPTSVREQIRSGQRAIVRLTLTGSNKRSPYELKDEWIRARDKPRVVYGDARRAELLLPMLDALAQRLVHAHGQAAVDEVRHVAHEQGLHLTRCPTECFLPPGIAAEWERDGRREGISDTPVPLDTPPEVG